jgi:putative ABC transport system permease protein
LYKNLLKTAFRYLRHNKVFTAINTLGLSIALAASFIILLFIINELSYNHFFKNKKNIYRLLNYSVSFKTTDSRTPYVLASTLKEKFPQVQKALNTGRLRGFKLKFKEDFINIPDAIATESEVFDIFSLKLIEKTSNQNLLQEPNSIILSKDLAEKLFPGENSIGKEVVVLVNNDEHTFIVNGVYENIPINSTFVAQCFVSSKWKLDEINKSYGITNADKDWSKNFGTTWVLLLESSDIKSLENQFRAFEVENISEKPTYQFSLQNLSDVYLKSENVNNSGIQGNMNNVKLFSAIALLILLIASINFILLSSALSTGRAKEIGIKKTIGAADKHIRYQLLGESILLALLVLPIALVFTWFALPYAGRLFQTNLQIISSNIFIYILSYLTLTVLIGVASGTYISYFLSRLRVIDILNKTTYNGKKRQYLRSSLIVIQLVIFCSFVSSTLIIRSQYHFALNNDFGYYNKNILLLNLGSDFNGYSALINSLKTDPDVIMAAGTEYGIPTEDGTTMMIPNFQDRNLKVQVEVMSVDFNFLKTMGISFFAGRDFSVDYGSDLSKSVILNQSAVKQLGISDPIGKMYFNKTIIGIVNDFNLHSIRKDIPPLVIEVTDKYIEQIAIHYKPGKLDKILPFVKSEWNKIAPDRQFKYSTIEEIKKDTYSLEKNLNSIISIFALFTLMIAALGLFGLTLFMTKTRTKEIGIKKVFGSSEHSIIYSFLRDNLILVLIGSLISIPLTLYFMTKWLNNFAFRTNINWWIFFASFLVSAFVVILTVFYHSYKASHCNPVKALRYE